MTGQHQGARVLRGANLFIRTRARLERTLDSERYSGWVESINQSHVRIRLKSPEHGILPGEAFAVRLAGKDHGAGFSAEVSNCDDSAIEFVVTSNVELLPKKENAHVCMDGQRCRIMCDGAEFEALTIDIAETGLGISSDSLLEPRSSIEFQIFTPIGNINGCGEALYCREEPECGRRYRIGIRVQGFNLIGQGRWNLLLNMSY